MGSEIVNVAVGGNEYRVVKMHFNLKRSTT